MNKLYYTLMICSLLLFSMNAYAQTSGSCGSDCNWDLDETGTLTISGRGDMNGYVVGSTPWFDYNSNVQ